jgi:hypothetical protein
MKRKTKKQKNQKPSWFKKLFTINSDVYSILQNAKTLNNAYDQLYDYLVNRYVPYPDFELIMKNDYQILVVPGNLLTLIAVGCVSHPQNLMYGIFPEGRFYDKMGCLKSTVDDVGFVIMFEEEGPECPPEITFSKLEKQRCKEIKWVPLLEILKPLNAKTLDILFPSIDEVNYLALFDVFDDDF